MYTTHRISLYVFPNDNHAVSGHHYADIPAGDETEVLLDAFSKALEDLEVRRQIPKWSEGDTVQINQYPNWFTYQFLGGMWRSGTGDRSEKSYHALTLTTADVNELHSNGKVHILVKDGAPVGHRKI